MQNQVFWLTSQKIFKIPYFSNLDGQRARHFEFSAIPLPNCVNSWGVKKREVTLETEGTSGIVKPSPHLIRSPNSSGESEASFFFFLPRFIHSPTVTNLLGKLSFPSYAQSIKRLFNIGKAPVSSNHSFLIAVMAGLLMSGDFLASSRHS